MAHIKQLIIFQIEILINNLKRSLKLMRNQSYDIVLIRHAESTFNEATANTANAMGIGHLCWQELIKIPQFNRQVSFNEIYMDALLSNKGYLQCENYWEECKKINPDLILVSPFRRTLETCNQLFRQPKCPIIVQPLLAQIFKFSCDIPLQQQNLSQKYPHFDFSKTQIHNNEWFLHNFNPKMQQILKEQLSHTEHYHNMKKVLTLMQENVISETPKMMRERAVKIKKMLAEYRKKYNVIAVVTHYNTIQFMKAAGFDENGDLIYHHGIRNCHPYYERLADLEKIV